MLHKMCIFALEKKLNMKRIRNIFKCVSLTAAMFVFQACYGTMEDYYENHITFHVVDNITGEPLQGIQIWIQYLHANDSTPYENSRYLVDYTDENGLANAWLESNLNQFLFIDKDSVYIPTDTIMSVKNGDTVNIVMRKQ